MLIQRRSLTARLVIDTSSVLHKMAGVLSGPERYVSMPREGGASSRVDSWRTRAASFRSEFVSMPLRLVEKTNSVTISCDQ